MKKDDERSKPKKKKVNYEMGDNIHDDVTLRRINWFPGHMNKAIRQIKERIKQVDIILEVRDARSPLVTANPKAHEAIGDKNRLVVLNKANLADPEKLKDWDTWFRRDGVPYVFINCFDKESLNKIINKSKKIIQDNKTKEDDGTKKKLKMMIIGLPNTGKSTIINKLAKRNATKAADRPGQTQKQLWVNVDETIEVLDTPGIMPPKIDSYEEGLWLAALHAIPEKIVKAEDSACFVVEHLLKEKCEIFKTKYKLDNFDSGLVETLNMIAKARGCIRKKGEFDYDRVYKLILQDFRAGDLGPISLGEPPEFKSQSDT